MFYFNYVNVRLFMHIVITHINLDVLVTVMFSKQRKGAVASRILQRKVL